MNHVIYIATKNWHKLKEIRQILSGLGFTVTGLDDVVFKGYDSPEEVGLTFKENAVIKAQALSEFIKEKGLSGYVLADDSGLECEDLNGEPGVLSARYAGPDATDDDNNKKLIATFEQMSHQTRAAQYVCSMVLIDPHGKMSHIEDYCTGHIVMVPKGQNGFGYDPYFYLEEYDKTMAEISAEEKNKISHRGKALRQLVQELKSERDKT